MRYLFHIRYGGTIRVIYSMKALHIDSYKVPAVDCNHEDTSDLTVTKFPHKSHIRHEDTSH